MKGFSLIELMIVLAIIAFLAMLAMPNFMKYLAKAHRTEALVNLRALYLAQKSYIGEHGKGTKNLQGADSLGWKPQGEVKYSYGFPGTAGQNFIMGSLKADSNTLKGGFVEGDRFSIVAAGDIDGDTVPDIISIDQDGKITIVNDDLA